MKTGINEAKTSLKPISCNSKSKFDYKKCNLNQKCNSNKRWCECKLSMNFVVLEEDYTWNPNVCSCDCSK